ncbi:sarcosine oxidase subunit alpha [Asanoa ishikariensis]|uniref:Sarcosine oxidase subunit alpha n=1 Tax=Asanoa ishikariensis TaxID=137265 RepID=A0A1H3TEP2_9ACTN|nr:2Fe-2S iron-sulfur cluster-binding protein [Asanoa ishikariensis]GIF62559.1 sarcosine oxidase subunit alpha [Asanoa ishikariensis]SDZ48773.1 sarcosine oxidase subunit alpha [Asanoa ishikariensis]
MSQAFRRAAGGRIDRSRTLNFHFDGRAFEAHPGDTLSSALLAHGVRVVARGPYTGRPRGTYGIGAEEPNAFVQVDSGPGEPMVRATTLEVYDGLVARSLAGRGELSDEPDHSRYDKTWAHCDVLVVGAGPAGLAAAHAAAVTGARVILADERPEPGGELLAGRAHLDGRPAMDWVRDVHARLTGLPEVRVLTRTTVTGFYDGNFLVAVQRRTDHLGADAPAHVARQRLWHIRAARVVLATGAHERPILFPDNDRPGIMLAAAAAGYAWRYGVLPGRRAVVAGAHDGALWAAVDLFDAGVELAAVLDVRRLPEGQVHRALRDRGVAVSAGHGVVGTDADADGVLEAAWVAPVDGSPRRVPCDLVATSGGWNPAVHLYSQAGGRPLWSADHAAFVPGDPVPAVSCVGAAAGTFGLADALAEGAEAGWQAGAGTHGGGGEEPLPPATDSVADAGAPAACWLTSDLRPDTVFVDLQRDATLHDVRRAVGAGMTSSEHVKRYTTAGTAADQGRTTGVTTVGVLAGLLGLPVGAVGTTTYRPPYTPISFGLLAGRDRGRLLDPERRTPMHERHEAADAVFENVGQWKRPWYYPRPGEDLDRAVERECRAAREGVAMMDVSTLGKISLSGPDVGEFLDRIYTNRFSTLKVGQCRYGVMCLADGMVFDDGVTARIAPDRWHLTTTTGNAAAVLDWLEEWLQTEWPSLRVSATSVTDQWAAVAVVGPGSREVLRRLAPSLDVSAPAFPFLSVRDATVAGIPARVFRISFTGELSYEINVPAWHGLALWDALLAQGITPYGTETMHVLRAEKGFIVAGQDTDGTVTPHDAGLGWAVSTAKHFIGSRSLARADTARADRKRLVGLLPADPSVVLAEGAQLVVDADAPTPVPMLGHVTSSYRSAALGRSFALALVAGGLTLRGETLYAVDAGRAQPVVVTEPVFYDPEGARRDG